MRILKEVVEAGGKTQFPSEEKHTMFGQSEKTTILSMSRSRLLLFDVQKKYLQGGLREKRSYLATDCISNVKITFATFGYFWNMPELGSSVANQTKDEDLCYMGVRPSLILRFFL